MSGAQHSCRPGLCAALLGCCSCIVSPKLQEDDQLASCSEKLKASRLYGIPRHREAAQMPNKSCHGGTRAGRLDSAHVPGASKGPLSRIESALKGRLKQLQQLLKLASMSATEPPEVPVSADNSLSAALDNPQRLKQQHVQVAHSGEGRSNA